jgi:small-conductance mechanosensitive channel
MRLIRQGGVQEPGGSFLAELSGGIESALGLEPEVQTKILLSVLALLVVWLVRRLVLRAVERKLKDPRARYRWSKSSGYAAFVLGILLLGQIWLEAIRDLGTFLGLLSAGLAIALRDLVTSMAGWLFIVLRHPFVVGDRVQVGEHRGDVVDIRLFQFTLLEIGNWVDSDQSTGRIIHIPNSRIFTDPLANYTDEFPYLWHEVPVLVTFESNWRKAKQIIQAAADRHVGRFAEDAEASVRRSSHRFMIVYGTMTPKVYTTVKENGVLLTLRFICPVRQRRGLAETIWEAILEGFSPAPDIDLAYPTRRIFSNLVEGKEGARADLPSLTDRPSPRTPPRGA